MTAKQTVSALALLLMAMALQSAAYAQTTGQITGTVKDITGAVAPTATIIVVNESTGIKWQAHANQDGIYTVPLLQPGNYRINVASSAEFVG